MCRKSMNQPFWTLYLTVTSLMTKQKINHIQQNKMLLTVPMFTMLQRRSTLASNSFNQSVSIRLNLHSTRKPKPRMTRETTCLCSLARALSVSWLQSHSPLAVLANPCIHIVVDRACRSQLLAVSCYTDHDSQLVPHTDHDSQPCP